MPGIKMTAEQLSERLDKAIEKAVGPKLVLLQKAQENLDAKVKELENKKTTSWMEDVYQNSSLKSEPVEAEKEKGVKIARMVRALAVAKGDPQRALYVARKVWGNESAVTKALLAGSLTDGGVLVHPEFSTELIELLRPASVVRSLSPRTVPLNSGTLTLPKITGGASAEYTGESVNMLKTQQTTGQITLTAKKLAALVPISNDLLRFGSISADQMVRDDLVAALAQRQDLAFIRGLGVGGEPKGLRYQAAAANIVAAASATSPTIAQITTELDAAWLALRNANVRFQNPGWLMAPKTEKVLRGAKNANAIFIYRDDMAAGRLEGWPYRSTTQIPTNLGGSANESELYLVDFSDIVIGDSDEVVIDASPFAAYHDGSAVQAAFSRDETAIRAIERHDLGCRHEQSIAVRTALNWNVAP